MWAMPWIFIEYIFLVTILFSVIRLILNFQRRTLPKYQLKTQKLQESNNLKDLNNFTLAWSTEQFWR